MTARVEFNVIYHVVSDYICQSVPIADRNTAKIERCALIFVQSLAASYREFRDVLPLIDQLCDAALRAYRTEIDIH
jgi:hypothetical protein